MFIIFKQSESDRQQFNVAAVIEDKKDEVEALSFYLERVAPEQKAGHYAVVPGDKVIEFDVKPKFDVIVTPVTDPSTPYPASE